MSAEDEANEGPQTDGPQAEAPQAEARQNEARPAGWRGGILRGASLGLLLIIVACLGGGLVSGITALFFREEPAPTETLVVRPTPDVVVAVRDLARLESASFHMERVIDLTSRQPRLGGLLEAEDTILLVAAADVVAGVDLAEMTDGDVIIEPDTRRAYITLPPARVLSARLDNERTYVHRRQTDLLARRRESLETEARRSAERSLEQAAIEAGILTRAERNAARTVEALVRSLGYDDVIVRSRGAE